MRNLIAFTATTAISMIAVSAQAADKPSTINEWVKQASSAIEEKMEYPKTAAMTGETDTHTFVVTVNRQGDILEITKGDKVKRNYFDAASNRALRYVDLPDLPASY
jgi:translation elongation factor EF-Ts